MNLEHTLQTLRQKAFPKRHALETELTALRGEHTRVVDELDSVRDALAKTRDEDARRLTDLQQQLDVLGGERRTAQEHIQTLEASLAEATVRQQGAEQHIQALESKLDETRSQHETSIGLTQETLLRLQSEQQGLLTLQTDLARTFHDVGKQLIESVQARAPEPRMSRWQAAAMGGLLFLSGALLSGLVLREDVQTVDISPLHEGIVDLQRLMKAHFESHDELLKILTKTLERETAAQEIPDADTAADTSRLVERQRADLQLLGFDPAGDIPGALNRFRSLYMPAIDGEPAVAPDEVDAVLGYYAEQARKDNRKYRIDSDVLAAIRLASKRTGVEFSYLMELAATESNFNPSAKAPTSTAVGLYQFKDETWLDTLRAHGGKYGLERFARQIEYTADSRGVMQPSISDAALLKTALDLRLDARLSALLAAEHARNNRRRLSRQLDRELDRTDLYLTHFFGPTGALSFLEALAEDPGRIARDIFPGPAKRNRSIFQDKARNPRTVAEVYRLFARKFNTSRFSDGEPG